MRVISDKTIKSLLTSLNSREVEKFQSQLQSSLSNYTQNHALIPERIVLSHPRTGSVHLFMPSFDSRVGIKTLGVSQEGLKGAIMIIDERNGDLLGVLNAFTLTAFRTALTSTLSLRKFIQKQKNQIITSFGNGPQAYWHIRLTLTLYPGLFSQVKIAVRSINSKSIQMSDQLTKEFPNVEFHLNDFGSTDLANSDVIYGCIPSTEPNIKFENINKAKPVFISIIGSYKPHMFEVDDETVLHIKSSKGKIIVDSSEHTLAEAGELIANNITTADIVEIGEIERFKADEIRGNSNIVLTKIVGLSIMDTCVGSQILEQSIEKNLGTETDF